MPEKRRIRRKEKQMKGVAFFFSFLAALEKRSREKVKEVSCQEQDDDDQNVVFQEKYWRAISYWIPIQSPNGMRVSTVPLHSVLYRPGWK